MPAFFQRLKNLPRRVGFSFGDAAPPGVECSYRSWSSARTDPSLRFRHSLFFAFVADISPQPVQLTPFDLVVSYQHPLNGFNVLSGFFEPLQDHVFFMTGRARQATDPIAFGNVGQSRENLVNGCSAPVKECAFRLRKDLLAGPASVTLPTGLGVTKLDYVVLMVSL